MPELGLLGSVRGALRNERPYRERRVLPFDFRSARMREPISIFVSRVGGKKSIQLLSQSKARDDHVQIHAEGRGRGGADPVVTLPPRSFPRATPLRALVLGGEWGETIPRFEATLIISTPYDENPTPKRLKWTRPIPS